MIRRDMPEVLAIERESFAYPWEDEHLLAAMRLRNVIGMVAEAGEKVVGFTVYELRPDYIQLLDFAVAADWRRRGVGSQMIAKLKTNLSSHRRTHAAACVRESMLPAQLFFRSQGFMGIGVVPEHFLDNGEDGFLMQYWLT